MASQKVRRTGLEKQCAKDMRLTAYETFGLYLALKNHFSKESYNYFKYQGKTNVSRESFMNRKDRFHFQKLSRMYDSDEMPDFMVANFLHNEKIWVGDLLQEERFSPSFRPWCGGGEDRNPLTNSLLRREEIPLSKLERFHGL